MTVIEMQVHMDCAGCVNNINKALQKLKGVDDIDIDMSLQKVTVTGWVDQKKVLRKVRKTGRRAELWQPYAYNPEFGNPNCTALYYNHHYSGATMTCYTQQPSGLSYNYYKHGYDGSDRGYYHLLAHSTIFGNRPGDAFSGENPHGCSIM